ncbi:MAG: BatD family protein, partial [Gammaproteobacteria bacterium]
DGSFIRIGQNEVYQKLINQQPYQVIEMKYALFPEKSGTLTIKGPTFNGNMFTGSMVTFTNANFKPVQATANTVQVTVKPIPAPANNSWWLPANDVQVSDKWSANLSDLQVGVPVTRTVKLAAQGIMASQLPNLITNNVPGFQVYPDKPQMTSSSDGSNVFGTRVETAAYIPTQAGTVTLPAIVVKWWNVQTDTMQTATIPAKTINILPAAGGASSPNASTGNATLAKQNQGTMTNLTATKTMPRLPIKSINYWVWIAGGVVVLWLLTVICWLFYRKRVTVKNKSIKMTDNANISAVADSLKQAKVRIEQAVKAQDPQLFATALIAFAQKVWPDATILSLTDIATKCKSVAAKEAIAALDKLRYSYSSGTWQAENTWQLIKDEFYIEKSTVKRDNGQLPKLYPE